MSNEFFSTKVVKRFTKFNNVEIGFGNVICGLSIYLNIKESNFFSFFGWFLSSLKSPQTQDFPIWFWYHLKALNEKGCAKVFLSGLLICYKSYWILNNFVNEILVKSKWIFLRKLGCTLGSLLVESSSTNSVAWGDILIKKPHLCERGWILNSFFHWNSIKIQKKIFNGNWILDSSSRRCAICHFQDSFNIMRFAQWHKPH